MLSLSKNVAHDYDANLAFSTHSSNLPHMQSWIDELVKMTEKSLPTRSEPTTTQLVECLQRYDAVFKEIIRQNIIFSEPLSKMTAKAWAGSMDLMDYMVKSYHKYVRHTGHLQNQAQELLAERQSQIAASKIQQEEFELQRTIMRAKTRNLEAEVLALKATQRGLDKEVAQLRTIISVYIQSKELSESCWDMMDAHNSGNFEKNDSSSHKENLDAAREHLKNMSRLDVEMNEGLSLVMKEEDLQRMCVSDMTELMRRNAGNFNSAIKVWLREPKVIKKYTQERGTQVDERHEFGVVNDLIESPRDFNPEQPPVIPDTFKIKGIAIPFQIRRRMSTFPRSLRILPLASVLQTILVIYIDKSRNDVDLVQRNIPVLDLAEYVYEYFKKVLGLGVIIDVQIVQFLTACAYHSKVHKRVSLFAYQIGLHQTEAYPVLDVRDTTFILQIIRKLGDLGELVVDTPPRGVTATIVFQSNILRTSAIATCSALFCKWLPDKGDDCIQKLKTMPGTAQGPRYLELDDVIDILFDLWSSIRISWEDHLGWLFAKYCSSYRVVGDVVFSNDVLGSSKDRDVMLVNIQKTSAMDCTRRPMRLIQRPDAVATTEEDATSRTSRVRQFKQGNLNKEAVCDALTFDEFCFAVAHMSPNTDRDTMNVMYDDACNLAYKIVLRVLEKMWVCCFDEKFKRNYYVNTVTEVAQWTKPYHQKNFKTREIEEDVFIKIIMKYDILATGPFIELLHNRPSDLWPNSEMFLKQQEQRYRKAETKRVEPLQTRSPQAIRKGQNKSKAKRSFRKSGDSNELFVVGSLDDVSVGDSSIQSVDKVDDDSVGTVNDVSEKEMDAYDWTSDIAEVLVAAKLEQDGDESLEKVV